MIPNIIIIHRIVITYMRISMENSPNIVSLVKTRKILLAHYLQGIKIEKWICIY